MVEASKETVKGNGNTASKKSVDRFQKVVTDRPMYRVDSCYKSPLIGYLLGIGAMPQTKEGKDWNAFVILTTEPTLACPTGSTVATEVPAGTEVTLGESYQTQELRKYIRPDKMVEVRIETSPDKVKLAGNKTMRVFNIGADFEGAIARPPRYSLPTAALPPTKQLVASNEEPDMPF